MSCAPFPDQSAFIQHAYDGSAVAIAPDFDPAIFDPASDIGVFRREIIRRGFACRAGLLGRGRRRINDMETKGDGMFAKSAVRHGRTGAFGDQPLRCQSQRDAVGLRSRHLANGFIARMLVQLNVIAGEIRLAARMNPGASQREQAL